MRLFQLVAMVAVPVVGLVALSPARAEAAPARAAKRSTSAKKGAPSAAPLPAPKTDVLPQLPQLPPATRDVTAFTTLTPASNGETASAASAAAGATVTLTSGAPEGAALVAATEPAPAARETVTAKENEIAETKPTGWVLQLGSGGLFPATTFVPGAKTLGPGVSFDVRLGYYPAPHVGVLVGFRGSYGHELPGCNDSCSGYSLQAPIMLQFAAQDRTRGFYSEVGVGLGTTYAGSAGGVTYSLSSPVELKTGIGYRFAGSGGARRSTTLDLNLGMDVGSITSEEVHTVDLSYSGKVDGATHVVVALSAIMHFSL